MSFLHKIYKTILLKNLTQYQNCPSFYYLKEVKSSVKTFKDRKKNIGTLIKDKNKSETKSISVLTLLLVQITKRGKIYLRTYISTTIKRIIT